MKKKLRNVVRDIMEDYPEARNNDDILYLYTCERFNGDVSFRPFSEVMRCRKLLGLPSVCSVERAGRKIRSDYPELKGDANVEAGRELQEEEYRMYYGRRGY